MGRGRHLSSRPAIRQCDGEHISAWYGGFSHHAMVCADLELT
jgi:hypothetical protein